MTMLPNEYFNKDASELARNLLGKVICRILPSLTLYAQIIETEAYYKHEKGSHASLGWTAKRAALFMPAGTIYMYYARGKDSFNISSYGEGNAVLIKACVPYAQAPNYEAMIDHMQYLNPLGERKRQPHFLLSGQTLLCQALNIKVTEWDKRSFDPQALCIQDIGYFPKKITVTPRLGIPLGRDEHLPYRFIDAAYSRFASRGRMNSSEVAT